MDGDRDDLGEWLRRVREHAGLSQEELAARTSVSPRTVSDIERGISSTPRAATLRALADELGVEFPRSVRADEDRTADDAFGTESGFAQLLRRHRVAAGLTQRELARTALISERAVSDLERGINRTARRETAVLLADALGLDGLRRERFFADASGTEFTPAASDSPHDASLQHKGMQQARAPLVGRTDDLAEVIRALADARIVTITGPGGVGKTRLATELLASFAARGDVTVFVAGATVRAVSDFVGAVASALGIRESGDVALDDLVEEQLGRVDLLVVDNLEHILGCAPIIQRWTNVHERMQTLLTSRVALRVAGERVMVLDPLATAAPSPASFTSSSSSASTLSPAAELFVHHARIERPDWTLEPEGRPVVEQICTQVDGLPLALELAAAWMRVLDLTEILDRLDAPLRALRGGRRDLPQRHQALEATIEGSFAMLSPEARDLFARLSVFVAPFTLSAAEPVATGVVPGERDATELLAELVDSSLLRTVRTTGQPTRFTMLATLRDFASTRLGGSERDATIDAFIETFLERAEEAAPRLVGPDQEGWLTRLEQDRDHLRAAVDHCLDRSEGARARRLTAALWRFWYLRGHYGEGVPRLALALALPDADRRGTGAHAETGGELSNATATARYGLATITYLQGDVASAEAGYRRALDEFRAVGDVNGESATLSNLGMIAQYRGHLDEARQYYVDALGKAESHALTRQEAVALMNLGSLASDSGDIDTGERYYALAVTRFRALEDVRAATDLLGNLATISMAGGDLERAENLASEVLATYEQLGDRPGAAEALALLARIALLHRNWSAALGLCARSLAIAEDLGDRWGVAACLEITARVRLATGAFEQADADVVRAIALQRQLEHQRGVRGALLVAAELQRRQGALASARAMACEVAASSPPSDRPARNAAALLAAACFADVDPQRAALVASAVTLLERDARRALDEMATVQLHDALAAHGADASDPAHASAIGAAAPDVASLADLVDEALDAWCAHGT